MPADILAPWGAVQGDWWSSFKPVYKDDRHFFKTKSDLGHNLDNQAEWVKMAAVTLEDSVPLQQI